MIALIKLLQKARLLPRTSNFARVAAGLNVQTPILGLESGRVLLVLLQLDDSLQLLDLTLLRLSDCGRVTPVHGRVRLVLLQGHALMEIGMCRRHIRNGVGKHIV